MLCECCSNRRCLNSSANPLHRAGISTFSLCRTLKQTYICSINGRISKINSGCKTVLLYLNACFCMFWPTWCTRRRWQKIFRVKRKPAFLLPPLPGTTKGEKQLWLSHGSAEWKHSHCLFGFCFRVDYLFFFYREILLLSWKLCSEKNPPCAAPGGADTTPPPPFSLPPSALTCLPSSLSRGATNPGS